MIEFKGITTYDGTFSYKNESNRNLANHGTEFNKLIGGEFVDLAESGQVSEIQQYEDKKNFIESNVDVITYNFRYSNNNGNTIMRKLIFVAVNLIIFIYALSTVNSIELNRYEPVKIAEIQVVHKEIVIPTITLTNEIKAGMFLESLRIDTSMIRPREIVKCISPWEQYIIKYSSQYGVDPDLVRAIIYAESKGDPYVISRNGAQGLMQIMPATADFMGISNPFDPEENIKAGVKYITWLIKHKNKYDEKHLLWAWNAGPSKTDKKIMPHETQNFIIEVLSVKSFLKEDKT